MTKRLWKYTVQPCKSVTSLKTRCSGRNLNYAGMGRLAKLILSGFVSLGIWTTAIEDKQEQTEQTHTHIEKPNLGDVVRTPQIGDTGVRPITLNLANQMPPWSDFKPPSPSTSTLSAPPPPRTPPQPLASVEVDSIPQSRTDLFKDPLGVFW